jgi:cellulose synthase/poly-beta-1,6-N-acetylglucosamine synthase-like glycosyltransferase
MIRCTVGVLAHNEAHNIVRALHALLAQEMQEHAIDEIIVIASGCTDATVELAQGVAISFPIVKVEVETERSGKATAIRRLTALARGDVIVMVGADTLPERTSIEHLLQPFTNPRVGRPAPAPIPLNRPPWLVRGADAVARSPPRLRQPSASSSRSECGQEFPEDTTDSQPSKR